MTWPVSAVQEGQQERKQEDDCEQFSKTELPPLTVDESGTLGWPNWLSEFENVSVSNRRYYEYHTVGLTEFMWWSTLTWPSWFKYAASWGSLDSCSITKNSVSFNTLLSQLNEHLQSVLLSLARGADLEGRLGRACPAASSLIAPGMGRAPDHVGLVVFGKVLAGLEAFPPIRYVSDQSEVSETEIPVRGLVESAFVVIGQATPIPIGMPSSCDRRLFPLLALTHIRTVLCTLLRCKE